MDPMKNSLFAGKTETSDETAALIVAIFTNKGDRT